MELTALISSEYKERALEDADTLLEQEKRVFDEKNCESALEFFLEAKRLYEDLKSEKVKECDEWIEKRKKEMEKGICSGTFVVAVLVGSGTLHHELK